MKWLLDYFFMIDDWRELSDTDLAYLSLLAIAVVFSAALILSLW